MPFRPKNLLILVLTILLWTSCRNDCYPREEPLLKTNLTAASGFSRVYALGGNRNILPEGEGYRLPVSLNSDTTTYIFESKTRTDTLTIGYRREFFYESSRCGFAVRFVDDSGQVRFTTFRSVQVNLSRCYTVIFGRQTNCFDVQIFP